MLQLPYARFAGITVFPSDSLTSAASVLTPIQQHHGSIYTQTEDAQKSCSQGTQ